MIKNNKGDGMKFFSYQDEGDDDWEGEDEFEEDEDWGDEDDDDE